MNNKKELRPYLISLTVGMILVGIGADPYDRFRAGMR